MSDHRLLIDEIMRAVRDDEFNLTSREEQFLQSIARRQELTDKQDEWLESIWKKATGK